MSERIRIYLVRHGHVQYFNDDQQPINPKYAPLSKMGEEQIGLLAEQLTSINMDGVFSSTMPRSIQTAEILAKLQTKQQIESFDEIREIKSGRLKDIDAENAEIVIKKAYCHRQYSLGNFLQGESWQAFEQRVVSWMEQMLLQQVALKHQHILVSSHDAVNRVLLNWAYGRKNDDVQVQEQNYGCLNIIDFFIENDQVIEARILLQNFTAHNILKINETHNALDDVYHMYIKTNGFK